MVLFAILFQSLHSAEHLVAQLSEEHCHHDHNDGNAQFTHEHHGHKHCFVCEYSFSSFAYFEISSITKSVIYSVDSRIISHSAIFKENRINFYLSRGPPSIIV